MNEKKLNILLISQKSLRNKIKNIKIALSLKS